MTPPRAGDMIGTRPWRRTRCALTEDTNKQLVLTAMDLAFNQRDPEAAVELYADNFVGIGPNLAESGREDAVADLRLYLDAFSDSKISIENVIAEGDRVVVHFAGTGLHTGEFEGKPPTGAPVSVHGVIIARVQDNRIAQIWFTLNWG